MVAISHDRADASIESPADQSAVRTDGKAILASLMDRSIEQMQESNPTLAETLFTCAVLRWFDAEVVAGMRSPGEDQPKTDPALWRELQAMAYCEPHRTRERTWRFSDAFREHLLTRPEVADRQQALHARAAKTYQRMLAAKGLTGSQRFQDTDWRLVAGEWLTHALYANPKAGLTAIFRICAEALAIPVYGANWEIDFCVRLLGDLAWPPDRETVQRDIERLREGFSYLAAGKNAKAIGMIKALAKVPGLTTDQRSELHLFAGITHFYDEGRMGPALDELQRAVELTPHRSDIHATLAEVHCHPGVLWGRLDLARACAETAIRVEPEQAEGHVALGRIDALNEDWDAAIAHYEYAIQVESNDFAGYLALSEAYTARGEEVQAVLTIDKAWDISPWSGYDTSIRKGHAYLEARKFAQAQDAYERAIDQAPDLPAPYIALGHFYGALWKTLEAASMFRKAIAIDPTLEDGYVALAGLYEGQGKWQQAIDTCQEAEEAGAAGKGIHVVLSGVRSKQGHFEDLAAVQRQIVALDPLEQYASHCASGDAYLHQAWSAHAIAERARLLKEARRRYERALQEDVHRAWAYLSLGELAVLNGEDDRISNLERRVIAQTPWAHYDWLVHVGRSYLDNRHGDRCEGLLTRAVALAPARTAAWLALADLYTWQGEPASVARAWAKIVEIEPAQAYEAHIAVGNAYQLVEDFAEAHSEFLKAVAKEPATALAYYRLGQLAEIEGAWDEAVRYYEEAASRASGAGLFAGLSIARLQRSSGRFEEAKETLRQSLAMDPEDTETYLELARLGAVANQPKLIWEAQDHLARLAVDDRADPALAVGYIYLSAQDYSKAQGQFERCLQRDPTDVQAHIGLGQTLLERGQPDRADEALNRAIAIDDRAIDAYIALSRVHAARHNVQGVIAAQERIVALDPKEAYNALTNIGAAYESVKAGTKAETHYREAITLCPWRPEAYVDLATLLASQGRFDEAEALYEQARREADLTYLSLGRYYEGLEKERDALRVYHLGMEIAPPEARPELYLAAGSLHNRLGEVAEAERDYRRSIELEPEWAEGYVALMSLLVEQGRRAGALRVGRKMAARPALAYNAYMSLGNLLADQRASTAAKYYRRAMALAPEIADAYEELGQLLLDQDRLEDAVQVYHRMAEEPDLACDAYLLLGNLWASVQAPDRAEEAYQHAIQEDDTRIDGYLRLAQLYQNQAEHEAAEAKIHQALALAPDHPEAHFRLGQLREAQLRIDTAIEQYRRVADLQPDAASAMHEHIGDLLIGQGRDEARDALEQAVALDPGNAGAYFSLGTLSEQQDDLAQAIELYTRVITLDPTYFDAYVALGQIYGQEGNTSAIQDLVETIATLDVAAEEAYAALMATASLYRAEGAGEEAATTYRRAIELEPEWTDGYVELMVLLVEQDRRDEAVQVGRRMAAQPALAYDAYLMLGNLWAGAGLPDRAEEAYQHAIREDDTQIAGYLSLAQLYQNQAKQEDAETMIDQALALAPDHPEAHFLLGQLREAQARIDTAIEQYRRVADLQPDAASAMYEHVGDLLIRQNRDDEAQEALQQAIHHNPDNAGAYFSLGTLYEQQGDLAQAAETYTHVIDLNPEYLDAYPALARIYGYQASIPKLDQLSTKVSGLELAPDIRYDIHLAIGSAYQDVGAYVWALDEFTHARALDDTRTDAYLALGQLYEAQGQWADARATYAHLDTLVPAWETDVHLKLGALFRLEGNQEAAEQQFRDAIQSAPDRWDGYYALGQLYEDLSRWGEALQAFRALTQREDLEAPILSSAYLDLAIIHRELGDAEAMMNACSRVITIVENLDAPGNDLLRHQGLAHLIADQYEAARASLILALEINPNDSRAHSYLALTLAAEGKTETARTHLEESLRLAETPGELKTAVQEAQHRVAHQPESAGVQELLDLLIAGEGQQA